MKEEYSSDGDTDDESQSSQMKRLLKLKVEIGITKKMQIMFNGQIDTINKRSDIN